MPSGAIQDVSSRSSNSNADPFAAQQSQMEFVIPSPVTLSDAKEDVTPSQYRKKMARKETSDNFLDEASENDDGEERKSLSMIVVTIPRRRMTCFRTN
jgi:hypothetical protein